jgi:hypothetical protein
MSRTLLPADGRDLAASTKTGPGMCIPEPVLLWKDVSRKLFGRHSRLTEGQHQPVGIGKKRCVIDHIENLGIVETKIS